MKAYVARLNADQTHPREIVGFYFANSRRQLLEMIDECCDVETVEIMELGRGGIYWSGAVDYTVPEPKDDASPGLPANATVCEWWLGAIFDENEDKWEQITFA